MLSLNVGKKKREQGPRGGKTGLAKAEGRTGGCQGVGGQPRPAPTAAWELAAQAEEVQGGDLASERL